MLYAQPFAFSSFGSESHDMRKFPFARLPGIRDSNRMHSITNNAKPAVLTHSLKRREKCGSKMRPTKK